MTLFLTSDDAMHGITSSFGLAQLAILLILMSNFKDPDFSIYTTTLLNATDTSHAMEVEVDVFSSMPVYLATSASSFVFSLVTRRLKPDRDLAYSIEGIQELAPWEYGFWSTVMMHHATMILFMCAPVDWYFLFLTVAGLTLTLLLLARLYLVEGASQTRGNFLMLVCGALYFTLYTAVKRHGHAGFLAGLMVMDALVLVGHTFDPTPNMQTVGNCRLTYQMGMSAMMLISFVK